MLYKYVQGWIVCMTFVPGVERSYHFIGIRWLIRHWAVYNRRRRKKKTRKLDLGNPSYSLLVSPEFIGRRVSSFVLHQRKPGGILRRIMWCRFKWFYIGAFSKYDTSEHWDTDFFSWIRYERCSIFTTRGLWDQSPSTLSHVLVLGSNNHEDTSNRIPE